MIYVLGIYDLQAVGELVHLDPGIGIRPAGYKKPENAGFTLPVKLSILPKQLRYLAILAGCQGKLSAPVSGQNNPDTESELSYPLSDKNGQIQSLRYPAITLVSGQNKWSDTGVKVCQFKFVNILYSIWVKIDCGNTYLQ